jgi:hypothetical protein
MQMQDTSMPLDFNSKMSWPLLKVNSVDEAYQLALKVKEN